MLSFIPPPIPYGLFKKELSVAKRRFGVLINSGADCAGCSKISEPIGTLRSVPTDEQALQKCRSAH
jgi:hypothetical protein